MEGRLELIAACGFGLEAVVARELQDLGFEDAKASGTGRVRFGGDREAVAKANVWLRSADRVLIEVASFPGADFDQLFEGVKAIGWRDWLARDARVTVRAKSVRSKLTSIPAVQRASKKAIVEGYGGELPETGAEVSVEVALVSDEASVCLDTSGVGLHKRGYRDLAAAAQLRETLAAGLVQLSFFRRGVPFWDPFCGSGTIAIEAALIAVGAAPNEGREFDAERWGMIDERVWEDVREEAREKRAEGQREVEPASIMATDIDGEVLSLARRHAQRAGVSELIHIQRQDARDLRSKREFGVVVTNPPYGVRIGEEHELDDLYHALPGALARLETWSHFILTAYPNLERVMGREADRRRKLYNGRIECTYYQFFGPRRGEEEGRAAFGALDERVEKQAELFGVTLAKRVRHLRKWADRGVPCHRLYEKNLPDVPLVIDRYGDHLHVVEMERPNERDAAQQTRWMELMASTASNVTGVEIRRVHVKQKRRQRGRTQHEKVGESGNRFPVTEGGLTFLVNLDDYVDTGLFLDHRVLRSIVRDEASGKRFLNMFCYTGSFTVYAAAGGAKETTSVDLSSTYLDWARENLRANDLWDDDRHRLVRSDSMDFLDRHRPGEHYDLVVVDPPTFSNSKRTEDDWITQRDHAELLTRLAPLVAAGGVVYFSCNDRRFKLDEESVGRDFEVREISSRTVPEDFRNKRIHRSWRLARRT